MTTSTPSWQEKLKEAVQDATEAKLASVPSSRVLVVDDMSGHMSKEQMDEALASVRSAVDGGILEGVIVPAGTPGAIVITDGESVDGYPDLTGLTTVKIPHRDMILDGVCDACACCGQPLTDSVSVQRGMGPRCSRKGYAEEPKDPDEMAAFICLAEFQELAEFLGKHYKPLGVRGLVNGLVRAGSLNRPRGRGQKDGNEKLFRACCDAVEALGYPKMAELLRETLVVAWLVKSEDEPGISYLRTKIRATPGWFEFEALSTLKGATWVRGSKSFRVPLHHPDNEAVLTPSNVEGTHGPSGPAKSNKRIVWELLLKAFEGQAVKIDGQVKAIKVAKK